MGFFMPSPPSPPPPPPPPPPPAPTPEELGAPDTDEANQQRDLARRRGRGQRRAGATVLGESSGGGLKTLLGE